MGQAATGRDKRQAFVVGTERGERWFVATVSREEDGTVYGYITDHGRCVYGTTFGTWFEPEGLFDLVA